MIQNHFNLHLSNTAQKRPLNAQHKTPVKFGEAEKSLEQMFQEAAAQHPGLAQQVQEDMYVPVRAKPKEQELFLPLKSLDGELDAPVVEFDFAAAKRFLLETHDVGLDERGHIPGTEVLRLFASGRSEMDTGDLEPKYGRIVPYKWTETLDRLQRAGVLQASKERIGRQTTAQLSLTPRAQEDPLIRKALAGEDISNEADSRISNGIAVEIMNPVPYQPQAALSFATDSFRLGRDDNYKRIPAKDVLQLFATPDGRPMDNFQSLEEKYGDIIPTKWTPIVSHGLEIGVLEKIRQGPKITVRLSEAAYKDPNLQKVLNPPPLNLVA